MNEVHFVGKVAQKAIIVKGHSVLITRDSRDDVWELPGGRLNVDEEPIIGLKRELQEELGVEVHIERPFYIQPFVHGRDGSNALSITYLGCLADENKQFAVDPIEVAEWKWVTARDWKEYKLYPEYHDALALFFT